jgi:hypothetical protein
VVEADDDHKEDGMKTLQDGQTWRGLKLVDSDGDKTDHRGHLPRSPDRRAGMGGGVTTGLFGLTHTLVPIGDAEVTADNEIRVPLQKEKVKDARGSIPTASFHPRRSAGSGSTTAFRTSTSGRERTVRRRWPCPTRVRTGHGAWRRRPTAATELPQSSACGSGAWS